MKTILKSEFIGFESLTALLRAGILGLLIDKLPAGAIRVLHLFLADGSVLRIQSKVTEVEPWHEVGTLVLEHFAKAAEGETIQIPLPLSWLDIRSVEKLVLEGGKFIAESGLCISNRDYEQVIILPSAFPHAVQINAQFYPGDFDPEYEIAEYERVPEIG